MVDRTALNGVINSHRVQELRIIKFSMKEAVS